MLIEKVDVTLDFAIGESSTPQATIALANIADTYNLPRLKPLARYTGSWKETYPELDPADRSVVSPTFITQTLKTNYSLPQVQIVTIATSQWNRADLDAFLVDEVQASKHFDYCRQYR